MSLDMFLYKEIYIGANYDFSEVTGTIDIKKRNKPIKVNFNKVVSIIESVAKWNSAHHIHQWFVDNIQDGDDDCKRYCVSGEKLLELRYVCKDILNQKTTDEKIETAKELLSIYDRTEINADFLEDLEYTVNVLNDIDECCDYIYTSSW